VQDFLLSHHVARVHHHHDDLAMRRRRRETEPGYDGGGEQGEIGVGGVVNHEPVGPEAIVEMDYLRRILNQNIRWVS